jgi:4-amino-4-deoxy-L-arabinose transferase-like glycosyltransferase
LKPFLVTDLQANKLPRWLLFLLCFLYAVPGLIGRDPWRADDAANFGVGLTMARGGLSDWLIPNLAGLPMLDRGPLSGWVYAAAIKLLSIAGISEHLAVRCVAILLIFAGLAFIWHAVFELASRKGVQPSDPFGVAAGTTELGRALADSSILILMACFGLVARLHETSVDAIQFTWTCLVIYSLAICLERPRIGGVLFGLALAFTALTRGPYLAVTFICAWLLVMVISAPFRWVLKHMAVGAFVGCFAIVGAWSYFVDRIDPTFIPAWLESSKIGGPQFSTLSYYSRTFAWFYWPAWPIATWAVWRWRTRLDEPIIALCLGFIVILGASVMVQTTETESALLPLVPPFAILAAMGLPTLKRGVTSLIDWFAVISFTLFSIAVWAYWLAFVSGTPEKMAQSVGRIAPGFNPDFIWVEIVLGGLASVAWFALIQWRITRHTSTLWRPVTLSCGGLILTWFLLMTLWLPFFNERNTYRDVALSLNKKVALKNRCVELGTITSPSQIGTTERASFFYYSNMRFGKAAEKCTLKLLKDEGPAVGILNHDEPGWQLVWQGGRRNMKEERFRLYQRKAS